MTNRWLDKQVKSSREKTGLETQISGIDQFGCCVENRLERRWEMTKEHIAIGHVTMIRAVTDVLYQCGGNVYWGEVVEFKI